MSPTAPSKPSPKPWSGLYSTYLEADTLATGCVTQLLQSCLKCDTITGGKLMNQYWQVDQLRLAQ